MKHGVYSQDKDHLRASFCKPIITVEAYSYQRQKSCKSMFHGRILWTGVELQERPIPLKKRLHLKMLWKSKRFHCCPCHICSTIQDKIYGMHFFSWKDKCSHDKPKSIQFRLMVRARLYHYSLITLKLLFCENTALKDISPLLQMQS